MWHYEHDLERKENALDAIEEETTRRHVAAEALVDCYDFVVQVHDAIEQQGLYIPQSILSAFSEALELAVNKLICESWIDDPNWKV